MKFINNFIIAAALCFFATSCHNSTDNDISGKWLVKEINGKEIQQSMNIPSLTFNTEDNSYHGVTGVNILNGDFKLKDGTFIRRWCNDKDDGRLYLNVGGNELFRRTLKRL